MNRIEPSILAEGGNSLRIASDVADLPEPDSPTNPSVWPARRVNETWWTTGEEPKEMVRLSTWRRGVSTALMLRVLWS